MITLKRLIGALFLPLALGSASLATSVALAGPTPDEEFMQAIRKDAEKGDAVSQLWLGEIYAKGDGVKRDDKGATEWLRRAADQGNPDAQQELGLKYLQGQGVPQNNVVAWLWMNAAVAATSGEKQQAATRNRETVAAKMTPAQLAEAKKRLADTKPKAAR